MSGKGRRPCLYTAQDRTTNCGPIAIFNVLAHHGTPKQNINIYAIEADTRCSVQWGTTKAGISHVLKGLALKTKIIRKPKIRDVETAIDAGCSVIYLYMFDKGRAHYVFIYGQDKDTFWVANDIDKKRGNVPSMKMPKSYYTAQARKHPGSRKYKYFGVYPYCWVIWPPPEPKRKTRRRAKSRLIKNVKIHQMSKKQTWV